MSTTTEQMEKPKSVMHPIEIDAVKEELIAAEPQVSAEEQALVKQASDITSKLLLINPEDDEGKIQARSAMENMSHKLQLEAAKKSAMLKEPIKKLSARGDDGGPVANSLVDLKMQVEDLDPADFNFEAGWMSRTLGFLPFIGKPIKRYFTKYESASTVIEAIVNSLEDGAEQLKRDNITLQSDQASMRELTYKLNKAIKLGQIIDQQLTEKLETELPSDDPRYAFIQEELLFPLRQRIQDLQQQLAVNQQGVLTIEVIIRNNKELIRGVNRATNVTINALQVGVTLALALANQKIVLEKIQAVNKTTDDLIAGNAARLRQQGADIHKQAASTSLDMATLKKSFADINAALEDISVYRRSALPQMAQNILELDNLSSTTEEAIKKMEDAKVVRNDFDALEIS